MKSLRASAKSRWNREPGFFEVWYLTFNDGRTGDGYWIRFTNVVPKNVMESPYLNLWFTAFRKDGIVSIISENIKTREARFTDERIEIKDSFLSNDKTEGEIITTQHRVKWDLSIKDGIEFLHLPQQLYQIPLLHSYIASPNLSFEIEGKITIDGEELEISGRGTQSHIWGREMPDKWVWAHTEYFENHRGLLELLSVETDFGILGRVSSTRIFLRFEEEEFSFITINNLGFKDCSLFPEYIFFATGKKYKIEGKLYASKDRFAQYNYPMPSKKEVFCSNTERGSINIVVYKRETILRPFVYYTVLKNDGLTHYEFGRDRKIEDIPLLN